MANSDISRRTITLFRAFHELGERIYGANWTGQEYCHLEIENPDNPDFVRRKIDRNLDRANWNERQLQRIQKHLLQAGEHAVHSQLAARLQRTRQCIASRQELASRLKRQLPDIEEYFAHWRRGQEVFNHLFGAIRAGEIVPVTPDGVAYSIATWDDHPRLKINVVDSYAIFPRNLGRANRRMFVRFYEEGFRIWMLKQCPKEGVALPMTGQAAAARWLEEFFALINAEAPPKGLPAFYEFISKRFDISLRRAKKLVDDKRPDAWRNAGRPNKNSRTYAEWMREFQGN